MPETKSQTKSQGADTDGREAASKRAAALLRAFHADIGPADEPELTEALGDSPDELDVSIVKPGERRRSRKSALTRTA